MEETYDLQTEDETQSGGETQEGGREKDKERRAKLLRG
jgi:hypothetical protein